ncbi:hypothetical protein C8R45DRAFT_1085966 [Mycena sanguinolenta]|nr:hypothetical protein C8R45DRAFT_1085966 [Mycena sanguinolenta]
MAHYNAEAEPFEEASGGLSEISFFFLISLPQIQGNRSGQRRPSPGELDAFYRDMERTDLERKLSKPKRSSSIWSRKSLRRTSTNQSQSQPQPASAAKLTSPSTSSLANAYPRSLNGHDRGESADTVPPMPIMLSRSIVPDRLPELPAWYKENTNHSVRYPIHNPVGPRWYKNHHLVAPASTRPSRPPSVFSPSFPPIASSGEAGPAPSRSASNSPLPTPNSSQTDMRPRSRKTSQTARDNVDLLDVSDPWGAPWHHESPYDVGLSSSPASFEESGHSSPTAHGPTNAHAAASRSRSTSVATAQNRRKTVTPSPLSQSTSAIHLQVPEKAQISRKLSKRRTVGIFGRHTSAPTTPSDETNPRGESPASLGSSFLAPTSKNDRRGSVLGRLAKRFSIIRKPLPVAAPMQVIRQPSPEKRQPSPEKRQPSPEKRQPSPEKFHAPEPVKRVPPPLLHQESSFVVIHPQPEPARVEVDRTSSISIEAEVPYTMGRLTVANPDPGSVESTPVQREISLPREERAVEHERVPTDETIHSTSSKSPIAMQGVQLPARSPEPVASSSSLSVPSQRHSSSTIEPRPTSRSASPPPLSPPPPPPPEKPFQTPYREERSSSGPPASTERSSSPLTSKAQPSRGRVQSPPAGTSTSAGRPPSQSPTKAPAGRPQSQSPTKAKPMLEKPQPPPPSSPSPKLPAVPFPPHFEPPPVSPSDLAYMLPEMTADISPLSTSSILVNPPTPYTKEKPMPDEPDPAPPPVPSKRPSRDPSPVSVTGRETETFRLVRSASGTVYASSETIRAAGEQWEVIESSKSKGKNRSQDWESDSRKEQRRQAKADKEPDPDQRKSRSERYNRRSADGHHHRAPIPETLLSSSPPHQDRSKRDDERERKAERKPVNVDKPQPAPPGPAPPLPTRNPSRTSKSARPTSEVPTAEDMNQMKAREAWDMDRLWKARSMSGMEANGIAAAPVPPSVPPVPVPNGRSTEDLPAVYGSSHTAFMVSTPFQPPSSSTPIYYSMPPAPPSVVYPAGYPFDVGTPSTNHASPSSSEHASLSSHQPLPNPLPEPPRESPYEPAPLTLPDYWGKYAAASVTTAH